MGLLCDAADIVDNPAGSLAVLTRKRLGAAGWAGYFFGSLSLFVFLRMFMFIPGGIASFLVLFILLRTMNFVSAASVHLALETASAEGSALRLFLAFGLAEAFWAFAVPLAFFARLGYISPFLAFMLTLLIVFYARVRLIKGLYAAGSRKAVLSVLAPFYAMCVLGFMGFAWMLGWMIWAVS
jgi:hypothetical protein